MGQARQVIKDRVSGHLDGPLAVRPLQVLGRFVVEYFGHEDTLLAVAHRAGHTAVVAIDTVGQIGGQLLNVFSCRGGGGKQGIPGRDPFGQQGVDGALAVGRLLGGFQIQRGNKIRSFLRVRLQQKLAGGVHPPKPDLDVGRRGDEKFADPAGRRQLEIIGRAGSVAQGGL